MLQNFLKRVWNRIRVKCLLTFKQEKEELIVTRIGNFDIKINNDHALPRILNRWHYYSSNLPRLVKAAKKYYADLILIDVGANVGDTIALVRSQEYCPIVCIEGNINYFNILDQNIHQFEEVYAFLQYLGEKNETIHVKTESPLAGTQRIVPASSADLIEVITLDNFLEMNSNFRYAKLLKIDTDGYDLKIVRGALKYIADVKPILFIEYDRVFLSDIGDDGISTLQILEKLGYDKILFYDNFGRFILSAEMTDHLLIEQLHDYIEGKKSAFPYYDLCIFHAADSNIADEFISEEMLFRKST